MAQVASQRKNGLLTRIGRISPEILWCVVCALTAVSAISGGGRTVMTAILCLLAATPGILGGLWAWLRRTDATAFSGHFDIALWIIVASGLIALSGGYSSPLAVMLVLPVLACLASDDPVAAGGAALFAIPGYVLAVAGAQSGIIEPLADMQLLVIPLTLGALAMISVHVVGIAEKMDAQPRHSGRPRVSNMTPIIPAADEYALGDLNAHYIRERNDAINRLALAEQKLHAHADQIRHNAVSFSRRMRFFADLGPELRTPLDIMTGFSEEVAKTVVKTRSAQAAEYAAHIFHAGASLRILIDNMEDIARIASGGYRLLRCETDIDDITGSVYRTLAERAREKKVALIPMASCGTLIHADQRALRQMVLNLLGYCLNAASGQTAHAGLWVRADNGQVQIGAYLTDHAETPESIIRKSKPVRLPSADMPDSGLAVARAFAELHGGNLSSSVRADGRFGVWVLLPVADTQTPAAHTGAAIRLVS